MLRPGFLLRSFVFILLLLGQQALALEVRERLWGFDASVVPGRLNILSLRIANPSPQSYDGVLKLREMAGIGTTAGAPWAQPVFLSPGAERWVQFTVFVENSYEQFELEWARGKTFRIPQASNGPPARVILTAADSVSTAGSRVRAFSDAIFPASVAALDGLDLLALDYVPRWEIARRTALLDWVRRGGVLFVLPGADGQYPAFTDELAPLNISGDEARVGAGRVLRSPVLRRELSEKTFEERGFIAPRLEQNKSVTLYNLEQTFFARLAQLTRPQVRWSLINGLSALYLLLIAPAHYFLARRIDYRWALAAFVGCVAFFGWVFSAVGRRGYGEAQTVHSLSIARAIEPGRYDVTQWISAFATRGAAYSLSHQTAVNHYATISSEPINGTIQNGREGRFLVDIPLFSSRQFYHRAAMPGDDVSVTVEQWTEDGDQLQSLRLKIGAGFPAEVKEVCVRFRDRFYQLQRNGPELILGTTTYGSTYENFLPPAKVQEIAGAANINAAEHAEQELARLLPGLYVRHLEGLRHQPQAIIRGPQAPDGLELFVFARSPESFRLQGGDFTRETGYTLYVQPVLKP